jgi:hypothetical protein
MQKVLLVFLMITFATSVQSQKVRVLQNNPLAKLIAKINKEDRYAITFGKTILISCKKEEFYAQPWWVKHELAHVKQYKKHGVVRFLTIYLYYSVFRDYYDIPFEKEAVDAEFSGG